MKLSLLFAAVLLGLVFSGSSNAATDIPFTLKWTAYVDNSPANQPMVPARYSLKLRYAITPKGGAMGSWTTCGNSPMTIDILTSPCTVKAVNGGDMVSFMLEVHYKDPVMGDLVPTAPPVPLNYTVPSNPGPYTGVLSVSLTLPPAQ